MKISQGWMLFFQIIKLVIDVNCKREISSTLCGLLRKPHLLRREYVNEIAQSMVYSDL